jgi:hypothetical protein
MSDSKIKPLFDPEPEEPGFILYNSSFMSLFSNISFSTSFIEDFNFAFSYFKARS